MHLPQAPLAPTSLQYGLGKDVLFFLHIRENYISYNSNKNMLLINHAVCTFQPYHHAPHAFGFSGLLLCGWRLCYVLAPPNTKFTGKTNHSYTTTKQLEKRFWLCQKFRGQLFVPEPVVRRKGEKSINALAPLLLGAVAIFRMFVSTFYNGTILVTFRAKGTLVEFQVTTNLPLFSISFQNL